jgi:hypothetical protein
MPIDGDDVCGPTDGLTLNIYSPRHGVRLPSDDREVLLPATLHLNTVDVAWELLNSFPPGAASRNSPVRPFVAVVAPLSTLKWLTVALLERHHQPASLGLEAIGATGYPVTAHSRSWLEQAWGAPVIDNYSLSELPGYAYPSPRTGFLHATITDVWFELIDPITATPIRPRAGALGELVATTTHLSRLPLLRYRTGDIVELGAFEPELKSTGIRFRGRLSSSLVGQGKRRYLALSRDLLEVGEACADVALEPHPAEVLRLVPPCDIGVPKLLVDNNDGPRLRIETRFDPSRYPARADTVRESFAAVVDTSVRIELMRPGSLDVHHLVRKL